MPLAFLLTTYTTLGPIGYLCQKQGYRVAHPKPHTGTTAQQQVCSEWLKQSTQIRFISIENS